MKEEALESNGVTTKASLRVSVVSHDPILLKNLPQQPYLHGVLLSEINIPEALRGENLAENRYLLGDNLIQGEFDFYGFVSARWDERFPCWPNLASLDSLVEKVPKDFKSIFFAPNVVRLNSRQLVSWVHQQDQLHPGMSELIQELIEFNSIEIETTQTYNVVMGNNFILPKDVARDFLAFWQNSFEYLYQKYNLDFSYSYRCTKCGVRSEQGIGRSSRVRHAGFLMERVSALFFVSRLDLTPTHLRAGNLVPVRKLPFFRGFRVGSRLSRALYAVSPSGVICRRSHGKDRSTK